MGVDRSFAEVLYLSDDPARIQTVIANWDYLWFPIQDFVADDIMQSLSGNDLKDYVFRVDRSNDNVEVVALDGIF